jgi:hypothetical protein
MKPPIRLKPQLPIHVPSPKRIGHYGYNFTVATFGFRHANPHQNHQNKIYSKRHFFRTVAFCDIAHMQCTHECQQFFLATFGWMCPLPHTSSQYGVYVYWREIVHSSHLSQIPILAFTWRLASTYNFELSATMWTSRDG